jgi:hypothetical protein
VIRLVESGPATVGLHRVDREFDQTVGGAGEPRIGGQQLRAELLSQCELAGVVGAGTVAQLPDTGSQAGVAVADQRQLA